MSHYTKLAVCFSMIAASGLVLAEEPTWKSQAELGIVTTSGNSKTSTVNAKADGTYEKESWRHNLHAEILKTSSAGVISAEKYQISGQSDYKFNENDYVLDESIMKMIRSAVLNIRQPYPLVMVDVF